MSKIESFDLKVGRRVANKYTILHYLGGGLEGEVYKVIEGYTNKERAIKLFYPQQNKKFKVSSRYAKKLDKLRDCPIVMDYLAHEIVTLKGHRIACLISEFIDGQMLGEFLNKQKGCHS